MMLDSPEASFAVEAVREASLLACRIQQEMIGGELTKDDKSPVTVADFAVQALIARRLAEKLPGSALIGEEHAAALRLEEGSAALDQVTSFVRTAVPDATPEEVCGLIDRGSHPEGTRPPKTFWTLDPIDGTKGFLRREQYAVALALVKDGRVELGALGCPQLDEARRPSSAPVGSIVAAGRGHGCWWQPLQASDSSWQRLTVSQRADAANARLLRSVEKAHTNTDEIGQLVAALKITAVPVAMDSQAKYAVLASGEGDVLLRLISPSRPDYREKIWDQAAGSIVITEAGGRITDLDGQSLDFSRGRTLVKNRGILATNGRLHDAFLAALQKLGA
ncbi:MAG TPA: 3'(2'),5'-bisphosphate nucleotidase [Lacipirellulaceae bacterium]|jgi:3'(2'), 5'-bisphosphate nucleotidase|nr:3'(2'),5'-bisphosphate nucleotidase [Lacipirellulaceae bacterium]